MMTSETNLGMNRFTLRFPAPLEREFYDSYFENSRTLVRIVFMVNVALMAVWNIQAAILEPVYFF